MSDDRKSARHPSTDQVREHPHLAPISARQDVPRRTLRSSRMSKSPPVTIKATLDGNAFAGRDAPACEVRGKRGTSRLPDRSSSMATQPPVHLKGGSPRTAGQRFHAKLRVQITVPQHLPVAPLVPELQHDAFVEVQVRDPAPASRSGSQQRTPCSPPRHEPSTHTET